jgi:hypothetical protein
VCRMAGHWHGQKKQPHGRLRGPFPHQLEGLGEMLYPFVTQYERDGTGSGVKSRL